MSEALEFSAAESLPRSHCCFETLGGSAGAGGGGGRKKYDDDDYDSGKGRKGSGKGLSSQLIGRLCRVPLS